MCGIAGWIGPSRDEHALRAMTVAVAHRGPDGDGHEFLDLPGGLIAALGHRRLSIIDLARGAQPMASHDDRFTVTFNGEVYNYVELRDELVARGARFTTTSDTEVLLEAWRVWGVDCLRRFRGMFAFAIHDREDGTVALARDAFGKKPLYVADRTTPDGPMLVFASEIAALLAHPDVDARLDTDAMHQYLCWRYVPAPGTFFRGVRKLGPGSVLTWRDGRTTESRFWTPPEMVPVAERGGPPADAVGEFLAHFDDAVRLRLRADVAVGAFLSGGLDSASVVTAAAHLGASEIRTFSVGFRGDPASELPAAEATARDVGAIHTPLVLDTDSLTELLPGLSLHRGAPIAETADLPIHLMSMEAARHVKVVLSGEGSDELFAGYPKHVVEARLGDRPVLMRAAGRALLAASSVAPARARRLRIAGRAMAEPGFEHRMVRWFGALTPAERDAIWTGPRPANGAGPGGSRLPFEGIASGSPLSGVLHFDQTSWLPDNLLERMDMMTMSASIEGRSPFLDVELARFASRLPDEWRTTGRTTKRIVREALATRLPAEVLTRPKNGFRMPVTSWFRGPLRDPFRELLLSDDSIAGGFLDTRLVGRLADDHASGAANHDKTLWALYSLEVFLRAFDLDG